MGGGVEFVFYAASHTGFEGHGTGMAGCHQGQRLMWPLAMHGFSSHH